MPTPISGTTSYCTPAQFLQWYDARFVADRMQDLGVRVTNVSTDPNFASILQAASGRLEASLFKSQRYQLTDLQTVLGPPTTNSTVYLQKLVADLAASIIWARRPDNRAPRPLSFDKAEEDLEALANGIWIFGLQEKALAGKRMVVESPAGASPQPYTPLSQRGDRLLPIDPFSNIN
jgi:hypothetical protein